MNLLYWFVLVSLSNSFMCVSAVSNCCCSVIERDVDDNLLIFVVDEC